MRTVRFYTDHLGLSIFGPHPPPYEKHQIRIIPVLVTNRLTAANVAKWEAQSDGNPFNRVKKDRADMHVVFFSNFDASQNSKEIASCVASVMKMIAKNIDKNTHLACIMPYPVKPDCVAQESKSLGGKHNCTKVANTFEALSYILCENKIAHFSLYPLVRKQDVGSKTTHQNGKKFSFTFTGATARHLTILLTRVFAEFEDGKAWLCDQYHSRKDIRIKAETPRKHLSLLNYHAQISAVSHHGCEVESDHEVSSEDEIVVLEEHLDWGIPNKSVNTKIESVVQGASQKEKINAKVKGPITTKQIPAVCLIDISDD
jgi:hypothetical protein